MPLALVSQSPIPEVPAWTVAMDMDFPELHCEFFPPSGFLYINMYSRVRLKQNGENPVPQPGDFSMSWSINEAGTKHDVTEPQIVAEGILTQGPAFLNYQGQGHGVAFVLHPLIAYHFFRENLDTFTNGHADLCSLSCPEIKTFRDKLEDGEILSWEKEPMLGFFRKRISDPSRWKRDPIYYAVNLIIQKRGLIRVKDLAAEVCLSERSLERLFLQKVGVSPKTYANIWRFQFALLLLKSKKYPTLEELAFHAGYYDLPHFLKDFKAKTGDAFDRFLHEIPALTQLHQQVARTD
ncbi:MAG: helix-turn-helix transcriptional regulator [Bacteroidia bacterium]|nr:helix-turn-helix transcriptional regulator [Bacteroidia bacterium]